MRYAAAAAVLSLSYGPASQALPPDANPALTLKIAGSTIQDNNLVKLLLQACKKDGSGNTTLDQYQDTSGTGTFWKAFSCTLDSTKFTTTALTQTDPNLLILKRNRSGTITGIYPLLEPTKPINFMTVGSFCSKSSASTATAQGKWTCDDAQTGAVVQYTPDMGVSDIDPFIFRGVNYNTKIDSTNFNQPTVSQIANTLVVKNAGGVVQNTPVTLGLRNTLQEAQIASGALPTTCTVGDETTACMPSLSSSLLSSIFAGRVGKWSDVVVESGGTTTSLHDLATAKPTSELVHICRRNKGASTQAAINAYFLNTPCSGSGTVPVEVSNPVDGPVVVTPTQVTAEEICLDDFDQGTNAGNNNAAAAKAWAVGMLTTERNVPKSGAYPYHYRYVKIDGSAPSLEEVAAGHYTYFSEAAYVWRDPSGDDPKPSGDLLTVIEKIYAEATKPDLFGTLNAAIAQPWGNGSFIAVASQPSAAGYPVTPFDAAKPVSPYTHAPAGQTVDNCRIPQADEGTKPKL
jgi:hypothetical protein